ncbi:MAG: hypothetical protein JNM24_04160 [Bdellovibrionaceae bacterium]|nr:hypothetical protein [Pseudobdellovibrionaceae bacterium]
MILNILSILLKLIEGHRFITEAKKKGILAYLKFLQIVRTSILGAICVVFALQLFVFAFVGLILSGLYLAPIENEIKAWIIFGLCAFIVIFVGIVLSYLFSEKTWLKHSGVNNLIPK